MSGEEAALVDSIRAACKAMGVMLVVVEWEMTVPPRRWSGRGRDTGHRRSDVPRV